ncbi:fimbrial protein [Pseudomonas shahriarae]|uniref:fimbrial protein n=1 Tax=Pseudomonas shahriarae TaxID=2745512 RepID=UPI002360BA5D|nr:fimbrial protein [Pseudomonas shahriarae]MDD1135706.1 type 1 fimbrial protein [Pseudomonas shahriarae]
MGNCKRRARWLTLLPIIMANPVSAAPGNTPNMSFHGALVAEPCTLRPGDEAIELQFGTVVDKYLYKNQRTLGKLIELHLQECDVSQDSTVKLLFSGPENPELPGFLAVSGSTRGFAIGLERADGQPVLLNKQTKAWNLSKNETVISLKAFLQAEPDALDKQSITRGEFDAMMMFTLEYE